MSSIPKMDDLEQADTSAATATEGTEAATPAGGISRVQRERMRGLKIFGNYVIGRCVGLGGMAAVFEATNESLGRRLAVKVLHDELTYRDSILRRFFSEAKAASALEHPNIVKVIDYGRLPSMASPFIIMEFLEGDNLRDLRLREGPSSPETVLAYLAQVCSGLSAAHDKGIVHRDLKPGNLILSEVGDERVVKIVDFGIAKLTTSEVPSGVKTRTDMILGTPRYMSPEQARGIPIDHRADIYSLGVIAYEMLTGEPPYRARSAGDMVYQQATTQVIPVHELRPEVPGAWNDLIVRAMSTRPEERFQTSLDFAAAMIAATPHGARIVRKLGGVVAADLAGRSPPSRAPGPSASATPSVAESASTPRRRHAWVLAMGALVALGALVVSVVRPSEARQPPVGVIKPERIVAPEPALAVEPDPQPALAAESEAEEEPAPEPVASVVVPITTVPTGARLFINGEAYPDVTPVRVEVPLGARLQIVAQLPRHVREVAEIESVSEYEFVQLRLRRIRRPRRPTMRPSMRAAEMIENPMAEEPSPTIEAAMAMRPVTDEGLFDSRY